MKTLWYQVRWSLPLWAVLTLTNWWPENRLTVSIRGRMARPFIGVCGKRLQLGAYLTILSPSELQLGDDVYLAKGTWLNCMGGLTIEDEVVFGPYVVISTVQHRFHDASVRFGGSSAQPVTIGRGSWIAAHASVKCGVSIGPGNLVAANAAVVTDTPGGVVVGGVPAAILQDVPQGGATFTERSEYFASRPDQSAKARGQASGP